MEPHTPTPSTQDSAEQKDIQIMQSLRLAHERFGVPLNVTEIVDRTLAQNGFNSLNPAFTPSVEEWIHERITHQGYAGYNHGSFVEDQEGAIGFAKVHYGPDNFVITVNNDGTTRKLQVGGPKREALVLETLRANGYDAPQVLVYRAESPEGATPDIAETFEMLVIEAVLPEYGAVRKREDWSPALARLAAQKIATFAKPIAEVPLFANEKILLPVEELVRKLSSSNDAYELKLREVLDSYKHLDNPIVVHGDTWFNNIIARHDDSDIMFVDWELAGPGYQGQDAGRKLWDLMLKSDWSLTDDSEVARAFADEWCRTDDDRSSLTFGVMYESLRWISDRQDMINDTSTTETDRMRYLQEIDDIKLHALNILGTIIREVRHGAHAQST